MYQQLPNKIDLEFVRGSTVFTIKGATPIGRGRYRIDYHGEVAVLDTNVDKTSDVLFTITLDEDKCSGVDIGELL